MTVGSIQYLLGCWHEGLSPLLAVGWRLPSNACRVGLSEQQLSKLLPQDMGTKKAMRETSAKIEDTSPCFCKLIKEGISS